HSLAPCARGRQLRVRERSARPGGPRRVNRTAAREDHLAERARRDVHRRADRSLHHAYRRRRAVITKKTQRTRRRTKWNIFVPSWLIVVVIAAGCSSSARRHVRPVTLPDLSRVDPGVQTQIKERYNSLKQAMAGSTPDAELATAYGQYGMVLQAADFYDAAEPCYLNA